MAGIYIHIPFCRKACFYCDFHFTVSFQYRAAIVGGIVKEIKLRKGLIGVDEIVHSIYFGGGTPSVLNMAELDEILGAVYENFQVDKDAEITFECNPDDLNEDYLLMLKMMGINRLSIGLQSFNDDHLQWMNRSHTAVQSLSSVEIAASLGFNDITIDLIYGVPSLTNEEWRATVKRTLSLPINHLSAYSLTLEENTPYKKLVQQKKYLKPDEDQSSDHYEILIEEINNHGWEHYEVSNFCKVGNYSKHNTAYWQGVKYLGVGPSAHSFDLVNRSWNVSNNADYVSALEHGTEFNVLEELTIHDRLNEALLTGLRAKWGVNLIELTEKYNYSLLKRFPEELAYWQSIDWIKLTETNMRLTDAGLLFADYIASELFHTEDDDYSSQTLS